MILWRVSRFCDLMGIGGLRASGRWHTAGRPIVYLAESPAGAVVEVCVHTASNNVPPAIIMLQIEGPDISIPAVAPGDLKGDWIKDIDVTRGIGDRWLAEGSTVLFRVPSVVVPSTFNVLFNPVHARAREFEVTHVYVYPFDVRIKK
jgi:RES domain-containing protein